MRIQIIVLVDGKNQESIIKINSSCQKTNYANFLLLEKIDTPRTARSIPAIKIDISFRSD
jgi:hypothetical protein